MTTPRFADVHRILIRSANWVGDAIMSTPALHSVRRNFPNARITLLAKPWVVPVFKNNPDIDEVMVYATDARHAGLPGLWTLAGDIRKRRFDLAILLQNAFEAALLSFLAGIPQRMGFTTDGRTALLTERIRTWRPLKQGHLIDYYLGLLAGAGLALHGRRLALHISADERTSTRLLLDSLGLGGSRTLVGLNPGATYGTAKRWLPDRFAELGRRLVREVDARIIIFGSAGEAPIGQRIAGEIGAGAVNMCGRTPLREAMCLIGQCHLFVTNDSGLMHVAAALEVPQAAIIGPTDPVATGPVNRASCLVQVPDACPLSPCLEPDCPIIDHRCMTAISVDMVMTQALALLKISRERSA
ncbi:lipopolysaccharide heptosyltransferase II [uncultured Desulfosarcina sp.]|uniref:lipopolysaccharide heptosyltransferase II n=1 Tax=uncultured Desulfosarcina sp. TaxID=218289 RepID=UPI0029C7D910|nr:lipopolysaccharide heptosyltransferase II [uncultured Desulfosarcina sp.]